MGDAKAIMVRPIVRADANRIVRKYHYSGKIVNNSQLHFGVFMGDRCEGAMQFGPSLDKRKMQGLVAGTKWNEFIELNRMAFSDRLPRNSESRALSYALRFIRKQYPWMQWVVTFADGTQFELRYIYFLDPSAQERLTCPVLPFSEIQRVGAGMYRGKRAGSAVSGTTGSQPVGGGATPTPALSFDKIAADRLGAVPCPA